MQIIVGSCKYQHSLLRSCQHNQLLSVYIYPTLGIVNSLYDSMRIFLSNQNRDLRLTIRKPITLNQFPSSLQKFQKAAMVDNVLKRLTIRKPIRSKVYGKIQIKKKKIIHHQCPNQFKKWEGKSSLLMVLSTFFINNPENNKLLNIQEARKSEEGKINSTSNLTNLFGKKRRKKLLLSKKGELHT